MDMRKGRQLLEKMPEIKKAEIMRWDRSVTGQDFQGLCELLQTNSTRIQILGIDSKRP